MYNEQRTVYIEQCTVYIEQCTVYIEQCTAYNEQCTVYIEQCIAYNEQCTVQKKNRSCIHVVVQCTGQLVIHAHCAFYTAQYFKSIL